MQKAIIVILNYNGRHMLEQFLPSVVADSTFPIAVIDNASTDDSVAFLGDAYPFIRLIRLEANYGFAGGYTKGLGMIRGEYECYLLLNSDIEVTKNWDVKLIDWLRENEEMVAVQPKIMSFSNKLLFDHAGAAGGYLDALGYPYCRGRMLDTIEKDEGQYDNDLEVDWTSGACMGIKSEVFHEEGGFDHLFFAHMEEIDFCWRLRRKGYHLGYCGSVSVFHVGGATLDKSNPKKTYLNFRNSLLTLKKNLPTVDFLLKYICRMKLDMLAALRFLWLRQRGHAKMVLKAHIDFYGMRNKVAPFIGMKNDTNGKLKYLLWHYYVKGKRKYTEI